MRQVHQDRRGRRGLRATSDRRDLGENPEMQVGHQYHGDPRGQPVLRDLLELATYRVTRAHKGHRASRET